MNLQPALFFPWLLDSLSQDPAAWVQAVGAVIALGVAVGAPMNDVRRKRTAARRVLLELSRQALLKIRHTSTGASGATEDDDPEIYNDREVTLDFEVIDDTLSKINTDDLASSEASVELLKIRGALRRCSAEAADLRQAEGAGLDSWKDVIVPRYVLDVVKEAVERADFRLHHIFPKISREMNAEPRKPSAFKLARRKLGRLLMS